MNKAMVKSLSRLWGFRLSQNLLSKTPFWDDERRRAYTTDCVRQTLIEAIGVPYYAELFRQSGFDPRSARQGDRANLSNTCRNPASTRTPRRYRFPNPSACITVVILYYGAAISASP